jgi:Flp pilus assembly protein TadB
VEGLALTVALLCISLSVLALILGPKFTARQKTVRLKDEKLESAGAKAAASDLIYIIAGCIGGAGAAYAVTGSPLFTLLGFSGGFFVLQWIQKRRKQNMVDLLRSQYPEILSQIESASHGGLSAHQAFEDAVPNLPRPGKDVMYDVLRRVRTGEQIYDAMDTVIEETGWKELKTLSLGFKLNSSMGIDIGHICSHALEAHYDKESQQGQIRGAISQNMSTLKILSGLPFFVVGAARLASPEFTAPLFDTLAGGIFFMVCVGAIVLGNILARGMVRKTLMEG